MSNLTNDEANRIYEMVQDYIGGVRGRSAIYPGNYKTALDAVESLSFEDFINEIMTKEEMTHHELASRPHFLNGLIVDFEAAKQMCAEDLKARVKWENETKYMD